MFKDAGHAADHSESVQSIAIKLVTEQMKLANTDNDPKEATVFVLGSKGAGKSGIINKFFDREENSRPTLALEYSFGRRSGQTRGNDKQILNVWELGCLDNSNQLIEVPMRSHGLKNFAAIIALDLSQPTRLWPDLECALQGLKRSYEKLAKDRDNTGNQGHSENNRVSKEHQDAATLELLPFPVIIVGGKYDLFQDFDPEIKKHVCRCLRSISHAIGAALLFYSQNMTSLLKTMRDTFSHLGFGSPTNPFRSTSTDYNEPLMVWFGADSWEKIGVTPSNSERIGFAFDAEIRQVKNDSSQNRLPDDPAKDIGFRESLIDEMRAQKDEELMSLIRDTEIRSKFETVAS